MDMSVENVPSVLCPSLIPSEGLTLCFRKVQAEWVLEELSGNSVRLASLPGSVLACLTL